jgi:hypothetical protein
MRFERGITAEQRLREVTERMAAMGVRLRRKRDHSLHRAIDWALRVVTFGRMRTYLTEYVTTLGATIFLPDGWERISAGRRWEILEHELVHVEQFGRYGWVGMSVLYLLVPLPMGLAWGRARLEWEAYRVTLRCIAAHEGIEAVRSPALTAEIVRRFTGPDYGYMWPFPLVITRWIEEERSSIERDLAVQ